MRAILRCAALCVLLCATPGCGTVFRLFGKPKVVRVHPNMTGLDIHGVDLRFDVEVRNPYPIALRAPIVHYALDVQGREFTSSKVPAQVDLPARGTGTLQLPVRVRYGSLWAAYEDLRTADEIDYTLRGTFSPSALGQRIDLPLSYSGKLPVVRPPKVSEVSFRVSEASLLRTRLTIEAKVTNPNAFEVDIQGLGYTFKAGDVELGGLRASTSGAIGPRQDGQVVVVGEVSAAKAAIQLLRNGRLEKPSLTPTGTIKTPYGTVRLDRAAEK